MLDGKKLDIVQQLTNILVTCHQIVKKLVKLEDVQQKKKNKNNHAKITVMITDNV